MKEETRKKKTGDSGDHEKDQLRVHELGKVMELALTLDDNNNILAGGSINDEVDMLENVGIGQQTQRGEAYNAAEKKSGSYDDKLSDDLYSEKKILPQYNDPNINEGVTMNGSVVIAGEAEKRLEQLRTRVEDLNLLGKISSNFYTPTEAERRDKDYQAVYAKGDESSKSVQIEQTLPVIQEEATIIFLDNADDLKSSERVKKMSLKDKEEARYGAEAVTRLATTNASSSTIDNQDSESEAVIEMETKRFDIVLRLGKENDEPKVSEEVRGRDVPSGSMEVKSIAVDENPSSNGRHENGIRNQFITPKQMVQRLLLSRRFHEKRKLAQEEFKLKRMKLSHTPIINVRLR